MGYDCSGSYYGTSTCSRHAFVLPPHYPFCASLAFLPYLPSLSPSPPWFFRLQLSPPTEPMKESVALKSFSGKIGVMLLCCGSSNKYEKLDAKLERKMMEFKRNTSGRNNFRSFDSIILRFPQFRQGLKNIRGVFAQFDEDSNGIVDLEELKKCLQKLQLHLSEEEIEDLFCSCDADGSQGIQFNEFIVLLCLIYLLMEPSTSPHPTSRMGSPELEATFDTIVEAFLFLDNNGDGKLHKKDMVKALKEASPCEKSSSHITRIRFREMDGNRSGKVGFRDFLFALTDWVGLDSDDEIPIS